MSLPDTTDLAAEVQSQNGTAPEQLLLPLELGQAILTYLAQRPYVEVFELVAALQSLEKTE
jgi:hypothetical protein